jgi:hypothetical protein
MGQQRTSAPGAEMSASYAEADIIVSKADIANLGPTLTPKHVKLEKAKAKG